MSENILKEIEFQINATIRIKIEELSKDELQDIYNQAQELMSKNFYPYCEDSPIKLNLVDALMVVGFTYLHNKKLTHFEAVCMGKIADMRSLAMNLIYRLEDEGIIDIEASMKAEQTQLQFTDWSCRIKY